MCAVGGYVMSRICFTADHHIKLGQKKVPKEWQRNRFMLLAAELNKVECDYHVFGGDLLDVSNPSIEELGLLYEFLSEILKPIILIAGNHEMTSKTKDCFRFIKQMLTDLNVRLIEGFETIDGMDYIPYNCLYKEFPQTDSKLAVTHVRGEIPPHVLPEVDLEKFSKYDKVFAGDLHSYTNSQRNIHYPGSPFNTSFHRSIPSGGNGLFVIDTSTGDFRWCELRLPQLVRKTVSAAEDMVATEFHHTIYELEGDLDSLAKVEDSDLLDKKIATEIGTESTLKLEGSLSDEVAEYLTQIKGLPKERVQDIISLLKERKLD